MASTTVGIVSIHRAPQNVSKDTLDTSLKQLVDTLVVHPFVQQNLKRVELVVQTPHLEEHVRDLGLNEAFPTAMLLIDCDSIENYVQVLTHPELRRVFQAAEEQFGFKSNASVFSADVAIRLHHPVAEDGRPHATAMALIKVPSGLHPQEHNSNLDQLFAEWINEPQQGKHLRKHVIWTPNDDLNVYLGEMGFPDREHLLIAEIQGETLNDLKAIVGHPDFNDLFGGRTKWGHPFENSDCFSSDVTTRLTTDENGRPVVFSDNQA
ncbi:unnamed protein product [Mycena citricolor]|uniref:Uncharacterized protein n=1 Tax=Mycena citricolor TaxID=2018698 RepID=A0AAD2GZI4_9AGAR|nr:unnamed protein product [Mycena citricolor]